MSQLTSIQNLRNSDAMQSRVENVFKFLKGLNPAWDATWFFPIAIINVSNGGDDCQWVRSHTSTHHKGDGNLRISDKTMTATEIIEKLKGLRCDDETDFNKLNAALQANWMAGIVPAEVAAAQVPFEQASSQSTAAPAKVARKSSTVKPIATKASATKPTRLDEAKRLFNELTPKQKVELVAFAEQKILASKPCLEERAKLATVAG